MPSRAILYLRSSKDRSDVSIDAQRRALHDLAVRRGLVVVQEFADAVEHGRDIDRPGFAALIHALKQEGRNWDHVLTLDVERIARRRMISMIFENDCEQRGVRVVYSNIPESNPAMDMMMRTMLQGFAEYHSMISRAKGLAGMAENVRQGWRAGGRAPRGYKLEFHATGAIRDGAPVLKSRLIIDDETGSQVAAYLRLRALGLSRGVAVARLKLQWPPSSTHSMDWQALTYAGHTVWNMHAEKTKGGDRAEKRRPRAEWMIQRNTHPPLITDAEAEAILAQQERSQQGRRMKASPLLLTGLLVAPDGTAWHSDGCGFYRNGKGRKVKASTIEAFVIDRVRQDLASDAAAEHWLRALTGAMGQAPVDGRTIAGVERRIKTLTAQIAKTVDMAAALDNPAPVLRRVADLELARTQLADDLAAMLAQKDRADQASTIDAAQVRAMLRRVASGLPAAVADSEDDRALARQALADVLDRIILDPATLSVALHFCRATGDNLASPRGFEPLLQP